MEGVRFLRNASLPCWTTLLRAKGSHLFSPTRSAKLHSVQRCSAHRRFLGGMTKSFSHSLGLTVLRQIGSLSSRGFGRQRCVWLSSLASLDPVGFEVTAATFNQFVTFESVSSDIHPGRYLDVLGLTAALPAKSERLSCARARACTSIESTIPRANLNSAGVVQPGSADYYFAADGSPPSCPVHRKPR